MAIYSPENPKANLAALAKNEYPGRVLIQGYSAGGLAVQAYAIGGRSPSSTNRIFTLEDNTVSTEVFDKSVPTKDPSLTIYPALQRAGTTHVVSNGDQTFTALQYLRAGMSVQEALKTRKYEPDENQTPRISGFINIDPAATDKFGLSIILNCAAVPVPATHKFWTQDSPELDLLGPGIGYALHTYAGNSEGRLPSFDEDPFPVPLRDSAEAIAHDLWDNLAEGTRVAVVAKTIAPNGVVDFHIINKHQPAVA